MAFIIDFFVPPHTQLWQSESTKRPLVDTDIRLPRWIVSVCTRAMGNVFIFRQTVRELRVRL